MPWQQQQSCLCVTYWLQMLAYLYYFIPLYVMVIYSLLVPGCRAMPDWALIFAGAAGQVIL